MTDIAIIGIGCRFPGGVQSASDFFEFLARKGDGMVEVPADRWNSDLYFDADPDAIGRMYTRRGGFLTDPIWDFDPEFFGIAPREAAVMDPQQRLVLEVAVEALDDAGLAGAVAGRPVGVYVGAFTSDNMLARNSPLARASISSHTATSSTFTMLSNRLSYLLDLHGPSMTIDTACSSSLVAVHEAVQSIARGECELALAGGVNVMLQPETFISMCKGRFLAADGRCKTFDIDADGYARGEGSGMVVLRPLADAVAAGDRIYAVIKATGSNQDGRTAGITVPNPVAQAALAARVLAQSGLTSDRIGYVEAHGTGTAIGDPLELSAIGQVYGRPSGRARELVVGSVKPAIGHLEAAAGIASVIKAALSIQHRTILPQAWLRQLNPAIPFDALGVRIPTEPAELELATIAVNGFGYGGTNAHLIMTAPPPAVAVRTGPDRGVAVLPLSGRTEAAVRESAGRLAGLIEDRPDQIDQLVDGLWARRAHHPVRAYLTAGFEAAAPAEPTGPAEPAVPDWSTVTDRLRELAAGGGQAPARILPGEPAAPVFVFSGMGPQWWRMGRGLLAAGGAFAAEAARIDARFRGIAGWSIIDELLADEAGSRIASTEFAQPANFLLQVALVAELADHGVRPSAVVGHSVGEVSAGYVSGALSLSDALLVSYHRSRLQAKTAGTGGMLAVGLAPAEAAGWLAGFGGRLSIAAINSPSAVTVAGTEDALAELAGRLERAGVFARALRVEVPYHSQLMDPILPELLDVLAPLRPLPPTLPLVSTVTAEPVTGADWTAAYWRDNVRETVRFADAIATLVTAGHRAFVEVGPHPVLAGNISEILFSNAGNGGASGAGASVVATLRRDRPDQASLAEAIGELYRAGLVGTERRPGAAAGPVAHVQLPSYPWQRARHWQDDPAGARLRLGTAGTARLLGEPVGGQPAHSDRAEWQVELSTTTLPWLRDHVVDGLVLLPGAAYLDCALSAAAQLHERQPSALADLRFLAPLVIDEHDVPVLRISVDRATGRFRIQSRSAAPAAAHSWTVNATGRIVDGGYRPAERWSQPAGPAEQVAAAPFYASLSAAGLDYGPSFQRIVAAQRSGNQVRAELDAAELTGTGAGSSGYWAHPAITDAALQCVAALATSAGSPHAAGSHPHGAVVPARIGSVRWHRPLGPAPVATARLADRPGVHADIQLVDGAGELAMELFDVEFRPIRPDPVAADWLQALVYEPCWQDRPPAGTGPRPASCLVVSLGAGEQPTEPLARGLALALAPIRPELTAGEGNCALFEQAFEQALAAAGGELLQLVLVADGRTGPGQLDPGWAAVADLVAVASSVQRILERDQLADPAGNRQILATLVTRNALAPGGEVGGLAAGLAGLIGARRSLRNEQPALSWRLVDVTDGQPIGELVSELAAADGELADEVALRDGQRWVLGLRQSLAERTEADRARRLPAAEQDSVAVEFGHSGLLSELTLRAVDRQAPGPNQVEVKLSSAGLNYKDALKALGLLTGRELAGTYFGTDPGMECLGTVVRVGPGVSRFAVGDRLSLGVRNSLARYLTVDLDDGVVVAAPSVWSDLDCGSNLPFLTAHYALVEAARLRPGEVVLVHGGAGGMGLAAIAVARQLGARVIATASTPQRRAATIAAGASDALDSRSLNFVEQVYQLTGGHGADVVYSSAPGEVIRANLAVAAEFGRIVEIGKSDIYGGASLDLAPFDRNLSFIAIDMDRMLEHRRPVLLDVVEQTYQAFEDGRYRPLPVTSYPLTELAEAFGAVLRGEHVGRVVLRFDDEAVAAATARPAATGAVHGQAWYLITGGLGAFGLQTARWLADAGARQLVLAGRSGLPGEQARAIIDDLTARGVTVRVERLDVADLDQVRALLTDLAGTGLPLDGVFHAAGVIDDRPLTSVTVSSLRSVFEPKALGGWVLHQAVAEAGQSPSWFVLYSSVSAMTGTVPQIAYAAANTVLDQLAEHRRRLGLPALSVNWGALSGGMAQASDEVQRYLDVLGLRPIDMRAAAGALAQLQPAGYRQVGLIDIDWLRWSATHPASAGTARFAEQVRAAAGESDTHLRDELLRLPAEQRAEVLGYILAEQLAVVLGIPAEAIELTAALPDLGMDSLMAVELGARVNLALGMEVSALEFIRGSGLAAIAERLAHQLAGSEGVLNVG